jgi:hypothetical protein
VRQMEEQLARLDRDEGGGGDTRGARGGGSAGDGESKKILEEMMKRLSIKARAGAQAGDYEVKAGNHEFRETVGKPAGDGDVQMSGTEPNPNSNASLSRAQIRANLSRDLRELVELGIREIEAYDAHAADTAGMYNRALEKRRKSAGSVSTIAGPPVASTGGGAGSGGLTGIPRNA